MSSSGGHIETGKHKARPSTARKLATALGVKPAAPMAPANASTKEGN